MDKKMRQANNYNGEPGSYGENESLQKDSRRAEFQRLNLSDDFLFAKVMEDETVLKPLLEKILDIKPANKKSS